MRLAGVRSEVEQLGLGSFNVFVPTHPQAAQRTGSEMGVAVQAFAVDLFGWAWRFLSEEA